MIRLAETTILYLLLTAFALYGVMYLVPAVAEAVSAHLVRAAKGR